MQKHGILGGTFDPIHEGHLTLAQVALTQGQLDQIVWVPDGDAPHKAQKARSLYVDRCRMVEQAIAPYPEFRLEILPVRATPHYSIHTFQHIQTIYPPSEWYWIMGFDLFQTLPRWYQRHELIPALHWLVAPRPPLPCNLQPIIEQLHDQGINIQCHLLDISPLSISSSQIRQHYQHSNSPHPSLPSSIQTYIAAHRLYSPSPQDRSAHQGNLNWDR